MPNQTVRNVHVDAYLSNLSRLYRPQLFGNIADVVCPYLPVVKESDLYPVWDQGQFFATDVEDLVPDRGRPKKIEYSHSTDTYLTQKRELAWDISDRERANADSQIRLEQVKQDGTLGRLMLKREIRVADLLRKTTNGGKLTLGAAASAKWDAAATTYQDLATDAMTAKEAIRQAIGVDATHIVVPAAVAAGMHKSLLFQALQYTFGSQVARSLLEQPYPVLPPVLFGLQVLTPGQIKNTAHEGQTASYSDIWGEAVRVLYITQGPALEEPSVAYTFRSRPLQTRRWRDEEAEVDSFAVGQIIDERVVAPSAGYEISDCLT